MLVSVPTGAAGEGQAFAQDRLVAFDIPAQSLASALEAYGAVTGIEVFYDAALAAGHRSAPVKGLFSAERGLEALLRGTQYLPRVTGAGTISVEPSPREMAAQDTDLRRSFHRYDDYFALLQARLSHALCDSDRATTGSGEIIFRFWLAPAGYVSHANLVASGGDPERDRTAVGAIEGLQIDEPPPLGLPQPITMAIFPPATGERSGCAARDSRRE
jgi:hypothetical protein